MISYLNYHQEQLKEAQKRKAEIIKQQQISSLRRNLGYPLVMLLLLALTVSTHVLGEFYLIVGFNIDMLIVT